MQSMYIALQAKDGQTVVCSKDVEAKGTIL